jgi:hypothetical protein
VRSAYLALVGSLTLVGGCAGPVDDWPVPPARWESEHFVFRADSDPGESTATAAFFESHFELETRLFGIRWPAGVKIDYRQLDDGAEVARRCTANDYDATACAKDERILTTSSMRQHQLIHAYLRALGDPPPAIAEGMAMVYGCELEPIDLVVSPGDDPAALWSADFYNADSDVTRDSYLRAASFMRFVIDQHGLDAALRLYRRLPRQADRAMIDQALREEIGLDLDGVVAGWVERGAIGSASYCLWPEAALFPSRVAGDGPPIDLDVTPRVTHAKGIQGVFPLGAQRSLIVPRDGVYRFSIGALGIMSSSLLPVGEQKTIGFVGVTSVATVPSEAIVDLSMGPYWLDMIGRSIDKRVLVYWDAVPHVLAATCEDAGTLSPVTDQLVELLTWRPPAEACDAVRCTGWLAIAPETNVSAVFASAPGALAQPVEIVSRCEGGCGSCEPVTSPKLALMGGTTTYLQWRLERAGQPVPAPGESIGLTLGIGQLYR